MLPNHKLCLIPYWIVEAVQRRSLPIQTVFDFEKLSEIVSLNDLIGYCVLSRGTFEDILIGPAPGATNDDGLVADCTVVFNYDCHVLNILRNNGNSNAGAAVDEFIRAMGGENALHDPTIVEDVKSRLFTEESKQSRYEKPFIIYDILPEVSGVVIYPGYFAGPDLPTVQFDFIEALQKQLYVYADFNQVCRSPLFRRYLERLTSKEVIVAD